MDVCQMAAGKAGQLLKEHLGNVTPRHKGPGDLVTEADFAAQNAVREVVESHYPDHGFVGEEGAVLKAGLVPEFVWYVDPLDGTTNFVHGLRHFAVSIGIARRGELVCGVVYDPNAEELFSAIRGCGATLNGQPLRTSSVSGLADALVAVSLPVHAPRGHKAMEQVLDVIGVCQGVRRLGSAALNLCYVAAGRFDAYWDTKTQIWDVAAGVLMVREAGGTVSGLDGGPFDLARPAAVAAANAELHGELMQVLQRNS